MGDRRARVTAWPLAAARTFSTRTKRLKILLAAIGCARRGSQWCAHAVCGEVVNGQRKGYRLPGYLGKPNTLCFVTKPACRLASGKLVRVR